MAARSAIGAIAGIALLGLGMTACSSGSSSTSAGSASSTPSAETTPCPQSSGAPRSGPPSDAPSGAGKVILAKTVKPTDTSSSTVITPTGPQVQCGRTELTAHNDITYASPTARGKKQDLKLDLQVPKTAGKKPLVVYLTGGGFVMADRTSNLAGRTYVAEQGYAVASIEYRTVATGSTYKDGVADVKSAVRYLRAHAGQYGIDTSKVAVWGQSAGGYLAAMAGATSGTKQFESGDNLGQSSDVQAVVDQFGAGDLAKAADDFDAETKASYEAPGSFINAYVYGPGSKKTVATDPATDKAADPASYLNASSAPFILLQGDDDHIISPSQSLILLNALKAKGVEGTRYVVKGGNHGDMSFLGDTKAGIPWSTQKVMDPITGFLDKKLGS